MSSSNNAPLAQIDVRLHRFSVEESLQRLGISRKTFYRDVAAGRIKVIKHGGRTFVAAAEIARLCAA